jgi:hypothetical protein
MGQLLCLKILVGQVFDFGLAKVMQNHFCPSTVDVLWIRYPGSNMTISLYQTRQFMDLPRLLATVLSPGYPHHTSQRICNQTFDNLSSIIQEAQ